MTTPLDLGSGQSPIDISGWTASDAAAPTLEYSGGANSVERIERPPGFVMIHFARGSELRLGGQRWRLLQLHWHTPAEHTIESEEFSAEVHFVHANEQNELLVVGVLYRLGAADDGLQQVIEAAAADGVPTLAASDHAPQSDGFYHYLGSLTAAPFSEPVQWYVARTIRTASQRQVEQLQSLTNGPNARALQDRNHRSILCAGC